MLALKSYNDWKEGGGKGVWKFSGSSKPFPSAGKPIVRKNSGLFMNSLSRNSSTVEKSFDSSPIDQNSLGDLGMELNQMVCMLSAPIVGIIAFVCQRTPNKVISCFKLQDNSDSLHSFVRQLLSDKKQEDIPLVSWCFACFKMQYVVLWSIIFITCCMINYYT